MVWKVLEASDTLILGISGVYNGLLKCLDVFSVFIQFFAIVSYLQALCELSANN